jgi:molybdopterin biosynthesis enzyme
MLSSLADADGLVMLAEDETGFAAGDAVLFASFQDLEAL